MWLKTSDAAYLFVFFFLEPCMAQNLVASVNCDMKAVSLSWDASNGTKLYTVSAEGEYKSTGLTTNVTTAYFSDFSCGKNYSLTITPRSHYCPGNTSAPVSILTCRLYTSDISSIHVKDSDMSLAYMYRYKPMKK